MDCIIVGGGPAGLTAAIYLARFKRSFAVIDDGRSRVRDVPRIQNIPLFPEGISGEDILRRARASLDRHGGSVQQGRVTRLAMQPGEFQVEFDSEIGPDRKLACRRVILATGANDISPTMQGISDAIRDGLIRYCPICDGYESSALEIGVIGTPEKGLAEATFLSRTYGNRITLFSQVPLASWSQSSCPAPKTGDDNVKIVHEPVTRIFRSGSSVAVKCGASRQEYRFDAIYAAFGVQPMSSLAVALGAECETGGCLSVNSHNETSVKGLYAIGDVVSDLSQISVGFSHAALAATDVHNTLLS